VECAVAIQKLMVERNAETPEAKPILYRIGVNLGDVLSEGDDILGDGVNIAARLEGICEPGGILVSGSAFDHVQGKVRFVDLGERQLKNIARPVRAYSVDVGCPARPRAPTKTPITNREATRAGPWSPWDLSPALLRPAGGTGSSPTGRPPSRQACPRPPP
jgi:adenylate cyclase